MSGRTCQFCGKPLSRIWTGGGDYCSREHRNQHRLRLGMDRLMEANKVASLMRRRENLKPLTALHPVIAAVLENRSLPTVKIAPTPALATKFKPVPAALTTLSVLPKSEEYLPPLSHTVAGEQKPRLMASAGVPLRPRGVVVQIPPRRITSRVQLRQADFTVPPSVSIPHEAVHRPSEMRSVGPRKPVLGAFSRLRVQGATALFHQSCRVRPMVAGAITGMDLRVSKSQGFRLPEIRTRKTAIAPRMEGKIRGADAPRRIETQNESPTPESVPANLPITGRGPRGPASPGPASVAAVRWPSRGLLKPKAGSAASADVKVRVVTAAFDPTPPESTLHCDWYETMPRITMGYAEEPRRAQTAGEAGKAPVPAVIRVQENFDSGCNNWVGGVADWRLDAAGARTGSLALFLPSLELSDYEMEFLVRVESRSVNWVFRAADTNDYYRASLRVTADNGYEFTRCGVISGVAEPAVSAAVTGSSKSRTAISVRTRVKGNEFSVFVEGQAVDHWTDDRLPVGGIGFGGSPDDRARLYWVRLSYTGGPSNKDVKR